MPAAGDDDPAHVRDGAVAGDRLSLVVGAILLVVLVVLVFGTGMYAFQVQPPARLVTEVLIGILLIAWGVVAAVRPALRPTTPLAWPVALAMAAFAASVVFSERPRLSLEPALIGVASALTFLALTALLRRPAVRRLMATTILLLAVFLALAYLVQVGVGWIGYWSLLDRLAIPPLRPSFAGLTTGSPNLIATLLLLVAPLGAAVAWGRHGRWAAAGIGLLAVTALILTGSRGGYLGLAAGALAAVAIVAVQLRHRATELWATVRAAGRWAAAAGVAAAVTAALLAIVVLQRLTLSGADLRISLWAAAVHLFETSPIVGTGPGTWPQLKIAYAQPDEVNVVLPHAHSLLFQTLPEVGALGTVALAAFGLAVALRAIAAYRASAPRQRIEIAAVTVSLVAILAQQAFDYFFNLPAITLLTGLLIAWIDGMPSSGPEGGRAGAHGAVGELASRARRLRLGGERLAGALAVALAAILVLALPTVVRIDRAMLAADAASSSATAGDWAGALRGFETAHALDPDLGLYQVERAAALAHLDRLDEARAAYGAVVDEDLLAENVLSLATIDLQLGQSAEAARLARIGLQRGWRDANAAVNAGRILEATGSPDLALSAYASAVRADPPLIRASFWADSARTASRNDVANQARSLARGEGDIAAGALILAYAGRLDAALADVSGIADADTRALYDAVVEGIAGDRSRGVATLEARFLQRSSDFVAAAWLSQILALAGDDGARRWFEIASVIRADEAPVAANLLDELPSGADERSLGAWTDYPFAVYSRRGPADLWAPQFLVIGSSFRD